VDGRIDCQSHFAGRTQFGKMTANLILPAGRSSARICRRERSPGNVYESAGKRTKPVVRKWGQVKRIGKPDEMGVCALAFFVGYR
jgi:hypothetical protein